MMFTLVIGGAASDKSAYAEELILKYGEKRRTYIATMEPFDDECRQRIEKHRIQRKEKAFETVECFTNLSSVKLAEKGAVLLECMGNLAANERYSPKGAGADAYDDILAGVDALLEQCDDLVIVSNDVFGGFLTEFCLVRKFLEHLHNFLLVCIQHRTLIFVKRDIVRCLLENLERVAFTSSDVVQSNSQTFTKHNVSQNGTFLNLVQPNRVIFHIDSTTSATAIQAESDLRVLDRL